MRCPSGAAAPWHYGMRPGLVQRIIQVSDRHFVLVRINIDDRGTEQVVQILQYIAANSFRNHNMPEITHSSDNASCFHISFSFSARPLAPLAEEAGTANAVTGGVWRVQGHSLRHLLRTCHLPQRGRQDTPANLLQNTPLRQKNEGADRSFVFLYVTLRRR